MVETGVTLALGCDADLHVTQEMRVCNRNREAVRLQESGWYRDECRPFAVTGRGTFLLQRKPLSMGLKSSCRDNTAAAGN